jgi:hypothetical protein
MYAIKYTFTPGGAPRYYNGNPWIGDSPTKVEEATIYLTVFDAVEAALAQTEGGWSRVFHKRKEYTSIEIVKVSSRVEWTQTTTVKESPI